MKNLYGLALLTSLTAACDSEYSLSDAKSSNGTNMNPDDSVQTDPIPPFPFSMAIESCLELNKTACPVDLIEGELEEGCLKNADKNISYAEEQILESAKKFTGDNSITIEDVKAGAVSPATVYASNYDGNAILHFSFGNNADAYSNPEKLSIDTIRCSAKISSDGVIENVTNSFVKADQSEPANLSIFDFTIEGDSDTLTVYDNAYNSANPDYLFDSTFYVIDSTGTNISETAKAFAGEGEALFVY